MSAELCAEFLVGRFRLSAVRQDITDTAAFDVWARMQDGHPLTMSLCHQVIAELGSTARAHRVYHQVQQWQADTDRTRRLSRPLKRVAAQRRESE